MAHSYRDTPSAGTELQIDLGDGYVTIPGASEWSVDGFKRGVRSPTLLSSTHVVKKPGMPDMGQLKGKVYFDPNDATHQAIRARLQESAADAYADHDLFKLIYGGDGFATPANDTFEGFVSEFSISATDPETGTITADMTIEIVTVPVFNAGSPSE